MRLHATPQAFCFLSLVLVAQGMVLFNDGTTTPSNGLLSSSWKSSPAGLPGSGEGIQAIRKASTKTFRDQYMAKKYAKLKDDYYIADYDKKTVDYVKLNGQEPPKDLMIVTDHIFELQMLVIWMNRKGTIGEEVFDGAPLDKLKEALNGDKNVQNVTADLNCNKAKIVYQLMMQIIERGNGKCDRIPIGPVYFYTRSPSFIENMEWVTREIQSVLWEIYEKTDPNLPGRFAADMFRVIGCLTHEDGEDLRS